MIPPLPPLEQQHELYRLSIEEYRFEVNLTWDRTKYYLGFNTAIITIATGLLKLGGIWHVNAFISFLFLSGILACRLGIKTITTGHQYYRRTIYKKTLLEEILGLAKPRRSRRKQPHDRYDKRSGGT